MNSICRKFFSMRMPLFTIRKGRLKLLFCACYDNMEGSRKVASSPRNRALKISTGRVAAQWRQCKPLHFFVKTSAPGSVCAKQFSILQTLAS